MRKFIKNRQFHYKKNQFKYQKPQENQNSNTASAQEEGCTLQNDEEDDSDEADPNETLCLFNEYMQEQGPEMYAKFSQMKEEAEEGKF